MYHVDARDARPPILPAESLPGNREVSTRRRLTRMLLTKRGLKRLYFRHIAARLHALVATAGLGILLFGLAGRYDIGNFWVYLLLLAAASLTGMSRIDPLRLLTRSLRDGSKISAGILVPGFLIQAHWAIAALDAGRFHWSDAVPVLIQEYGLLALALSLAVAIWAIHVNGTLSTRSGLAETAHVEGPHPGPFALVRHPGSTAMLVALVSSGLALNSLLSMLPALVLIPLVIRYALREDKNLAEHLAGYSDYSATVRYLFIPGVW